MSNRSSITAFGSQADDVSEREPDWTADEERGPAAPEKDDGSNLVQWEDNDKENPRNWSILYKTAITLQLGFLAMSASLGSSIISPAQAVLVEEFSLREEVTVLTVSLFVLGFALGPMLWAPISEIWGRRWGLLPPMVALGLFSIGTAVSQTAAQLFITRFFGGVFGSAPVSNVSAAMGDLYNPKARGIAITFYAVCVVGGPTFGPVIGSAITESVGWRWTEYVEAIFVFVNVILGYFFLPEVYAPVLLKKKAQRLRKETGNEKLYHPHEQMKMDPKTIVTKYFVRPLKMLLTEHIVSLVAFYASFVYALLYMTLQIFPIVFIEMRGMSSVVGTLPFLAIFVGILCAVGINLANQHYYHQAMERAGGQAVPEARMPPVQVGSVIFAGGLFWFGWTASPEYHWILPVIAAAFIGAGFNTIFQQCINFLVDTFATYAASAVAANTILRSAFAAGLPLATRPMFDALGAGRAMSILGAVAALMIPVPLLFMKFGPRLRQQSRYARFDQG